MGRKLLIRAYKEGDENKILELWRAAHPEGGYDKEQWLRWWRWMYKDNPAGSGRIWLAEHDGKIVGQYAIVPIGIKIDSETIIGSLSLDTMTHPNYRREGLFETLAKEVYKQAERDGIYIVYGFPNKFSHPGFIKKLNWFDVSNMQIMIKPLNWRNSIKLRIKNKFLTEFLALGAVLAFDKIFYRAKRAPVVEGLTIAQVSSFDERINELWTRLSSQYRIMVVRNKDYLNWRYCALHDVDYSIYIAEKAGQICGYLVLRCMQREQIEVGIIFDIFAQSGDVAQCLVSKAIDHCKQDRVDLIYCSMIANKAHIKVIKRNGFLSIMPCIKKSPFCLYSSSPDISRDFLKASQNWLVQIGDSDTI